MKAYSIQTELMDHQRRAVEKLLPIRVGALFMDMGTGKTLTAMEIIRHRAEKIDRVVWTCPVSLKHSTALEIQKHVPGASVFVFDNKVTDTTLPNADWYIVGLESVGSSNRVYLALDKLVTDKTFVVVDESLYIKSPTAIRSQRMISTCKRSRYRLILTGTPMTQGVQDLFMQMFFLSPQILGYRSFYSFANKHLIYDDKYPDRVVSVVGEEELAAQVNPYVYQITKEECLDLPEKSYSGVHITDSGAIDSYEEVKRYYIGQIDEIESRKTFDPHWLSLLIFGLYTSLQKILSGYRYSWNYTEDKVEEVGRVRPQERLAALISLIESVDAHRKIIIWAKFKHDLYVIGEELTKKFGADSWVEFSGSKNEEEKAQAVEKFRTSARFFVATPSSGGHGLTLNEASYVIYYNNSFKYSERLQSEDRCHRIGQTHPVTYVDIVADGTIDEKILKTLSEKGSSLYTFQSELDEIKNDKEKIKEYIQQL